jgi:hypothetical protein
MAGKTPIDAPDTLRPAGMGDLVDVVANYDNGKYSLGFSMFYYATEMYLRDTAKLVAINGVMPSAQTIASGEYEYLTYYYAVLNKNLPPDAAARKLVAWFLSENGQKVALTAGYVPLTPIAGESDNFVYGYHGSTPENTTESSGTGGKEYLGVAYNPAMGYGEGMIYEHDENTLRIVNFDMAAYPAASEAVRAWLTDIFPDDEVVYQEISFCGDLINVSARVAPDGSDYFQQAQEYAVFDAKTGKQLALSDLFYDGVNYIDFINRNLVAEASPSSLVEGLDLWNSFDEKCVLRPFTGIPADYRKFRIVGNESGVRLIVYFDYGNPFFLIDYDFITPAINLPADLSPYARLWLIKNQAQQPIPPIRVAVPQVVFNYLSPSEKDEKINAAIMAAYEQAVQADVFRVFADKIGLSPDADFIWNIEANVWDGKLTVAFSHSPYNELNQQASGVVAMVTLDLATGEAVDTDYLRDELPADWKTKIVAVKYNDQYWYGEYDWEYTPPAGSELKRFRKTSYGTLAFEVIQPDGEVVAVSLNQ